MTTVEPNTIESTPTEPKTTDNYEHLALVSCFVVAVNCAAIFVPAILEAASHYVWVAGLLTVNVFCGAMLCPIFLSAHRAPNKLRALQFLAVISSVALCRHIGLF